MKRWMLTGEKDMRLEDVALEDLRPGWARLAPKFCGICGSDLHSYQGKHSMGLPPIVLGHEFSAVVESVGSSASASWAGRNVVMEPTAVSSSLLGAGAIGVLTGLVARALGLSPIVSVDIRPECLEQAQQSGIDRVVNARNESVPAIVRSTYPDGRNGLCGDLRPLEHGAGGCPQGHPHCVGGSTRGTSKRRRR